LAFAKSEERRLGKRNLRQRKLAACPVMTAWKKGIQETGDEREKKERGKDKKWG